MSNVITLDITLPNSINTRAIRAEFNTDGSISQNTRDDVEAALAEIVRNQLKVIVFLGNPLISAEIAMVAADKQLYGSDYC